jgi:hypothetical protein
MNRRWRLTACLTCCIFCAAAFGPCAKSQTFGFQLPGISCPISHCTPGLTDQEGMILPAAPLIILTQDTTVSGSGTGLGASSNGVDTIAVSYKSNSPGLVVYDQDGNPRWNSGTLFDSTAFYSAPIVDVAGKVIMADDQHLGLFNEDGSIFAFTQTPGGKPISPVITQNGAIVLATSGGPISVYSLQTGVLIGYLYPQDPGNPNYYDTFNTPCTVGNRIYVSMALRNDPNNTGRLYAFDIDPANTISPISMAWYYTYGGPSGASPLCTPNINGYAAIVSFDGDHSAPGNTGGPTIYTVADAGTSGLLQWTLPVPRPIRANMPYDSGPAGGSYLWYFSSGNSWIHEVRLTDGVQVASINTSQMLGTLPAGSRAIPASAMSMVEDSGSDPTMLVALQVFPMGSGGAYLAAINTRTRTLTWSVMLSSNDAVNRAAGQFPLIVDSSGRTRVTTTTFASGLVTIGAQ